MNNDYVWLNEVSQLFLEREYLLEGQTVDGRVDIICNTAEKILEKPGFAVRFKDNIKKGWYSLSTPIWSNFGTERGMPISCVVGDTLIDTKDGEKLASDIKIGDEVLTHKGRYRKVTEVILTEKSSNIYRLLAFHKPVIFLTGNHLVLTDQGWVRVDEIDVQSHNVAQTYPGVGGRIFENIKFYPVESIQLTARVEDVYDFTVEEDHSFSARGVVLHNCFGSHIGDNMESILSTQAEVGMMTKLGGGTSAYFGDLRPRGAKIKDNGESSGSVHFMQLFDGIINIISQGKCRRGQIAAYLPIDHDDIHEFLTIRTEGSPLQDISTGVCVCDQWMEDMIAGDAEKRKIWAKVLLSRSHSGYPYIFFTDNANRGTVDVYKDKGMEITHSNLCSEIMLPDSEDESFVCDLSSMNVFRYDEWKDTDAVELMVYFLNAVMDEFIEKAKKLKFMERAVKFAERHRALGIGWIGWHSYLQKNMIPFESLEAQRRNISIAKRIKKQAYAASEKLAKEYGEPEILKDYGRRNTTLLAIAPTTSSAFIIQQLSAGVEPHTTNYMIKDLQKGKFTIKNVHLEELLEKKGLNTDKVWDDILKHGGSVQHLDFLNQTEKDVFKTFSEISQKEVVVQAAQRQEFIDQGQSLNLMIHPEIPTKDVNTLFIDAWRMGVKALYYQRGVNAAQQFSRNLLTCSSCEG